MSNVISLPISREQEGVNIGVLRVVGGCNIELEEVEERKGGEEERSTPDWSAVDSQYCSSSRAQTQRETKKKCTK